jgi:rhodanese-related sulfurtransferase
MKKKFAFMMLISVLFTYPSINGYGQTPIFEHLSALQCDSLITANVNNPNFVILDVRTFTEHNMQHLTGAINRNYYLSNFSALIDSLNKNKTYLIHCASGGRSGNTFTLMQTMPFVEVYNMLGGINSWNSNSLPTTTLYAPQLMFVSETIVPNSVITVGDIDTIDVTVTNRANDLLIFQNITQLAGTEFSSNFDLGTSLSGADDYTFQIYYEPIDAVQDILEFTIESNGGTEMVSITRTGFMLLPEITLQSDTFIHFNTIGVGFSDSLSIIISNTGVADLTFTSLNQLVINPEFSSNFDLNTILLPGEDYECWFYYEPVDEIADTTVFTLISNGGTIEILTSGIGEFPVQITSLLADNPGIYPNPARDRIHIDGISGESPISFIIADLSGRIVHQACGIKNQSLDVSHLNNGCYIVQISYFQKTVTSRLLIER